MAGPPPLTNRRCAARGGRPEHDRISRHAGKREQHGARCSKDRIVFSRKPSFKVKRDPGLLMPRLGLLVTRRLVTGNDEHGYPAWLRPVEQAAGPLAVYARLGGQAQVRRRE